ncbi:RDD family protein [Polluticoccus soli]|uniref:RDD family protein n=1 Tax=Polluticoccus soli TaxID=3034150 RepID=UPI0023E322DF|nr:RDD family protein [Flavipsychrobacter sp. JY13-12]
MEPVVSSIFDEMEQYKPLPYASNWLRLANNLIDSIIALLLLLLIQNVLDVITTLSGINISGIFVSEEPLDRLLAYLCNSFFMFVLYLLFEGSTKGRTPGKLVTGTRAVREDNTPITWDDAVIRSLFRFIPFEALSAFSSNGLWHDRLSKTRVVKTRGY